MTETAATALSPTAAPFKRALSMEVLSVAPGWGVWRRGLGLELAWKPRLSAILLVQLNIAGYGYSQGYSATVLDSDYRAGLRWWMTDRPQLTGPYAGLGLDKSIYSSYIAIFDDTRWTGGGFSLNQHLTLYGDLGWQWIRRNGLLGALKISVPLYADWYWHLRSEPIWTQMTTLSLDLGYAW